MEKITPKTEDVEVTMCRVCLQHTETTIPIQNSTKVKEEMSYWDVILSISEIKTEICVDTPQQICTACAEKAETSYEFKMLCQHANKILQSELASKIINENHDSNKMEFVDEKYVHDFKLKTENLNESNSEGSYDTEDGLNRLKSNFKGFEFVNTDFNSSPGLKTENEIDFPCENCGNLPRSLKAHMTKCKGDYPETCNHCEFKPASHNNFIDHLDVIHNIKGQKVNVVCKVCGKVLKSKQILREHMDIHRGVKNFECKVCGKPFTHRASLYRHQKIHSVEKMNNCMECGARYKTVYSLRRHLLKAHRSDERYECKVCKKTYFSKFGLKQHMSVHKGVTEFK